VLSGRRTPEAFSLDSPAGSGAPASSGNGSDLADLWREIATDWRNMCLWLAN